MGFDVQEGSGWGLLDREDPPSTRRVRDLGLAPAVVLFNELAVPGIGGMYFGKPLIWAVLGIHLAEHAEMRGTYSKIRLANAVEAAACWKALFGQKQDKADLRFVRGSRAMIGTSRTFASIGTARGYISNPMRRTILQPLITLGIAEGPGIRRMNAMTLADTGKELLQMLDRKHDLRDLFLEWIRNPGTELKGSRSQEMRLSPYIAGSRIRKLLIELLTRDPVRIILWKWMRRVHANPAEARRLPPERETELTAGQLFFSLRARIQDLLERVEYRLGSTLRHRLAYAEAARGLHDSIQAVRDSAAAMEKAPPVARHRGTDGRQDGYPCNGTPSRRLPGRQRCRASQAACLPR